MVGALQLGDMAAMTVSTLEIKSMDIFKETLGHFPAMFIPTKPDVFDETVPNPNRVVFS